MRGSDTHAKSSVPYVGAGSRIRTLRVRDDCTPLTAKERGPEEESSAVPSCSSASSRATTSVPDWEHVRMDAGKATVAMGGRTPPVLAMITASGAMPSAVIAGETMQATPARRAVSDAGDVSAGALRLVKTSGNSTKYPLASTAPAVTLMADPSSAVCSDSAKSGVIDGLRDGAGVRESEDPVDLVPLGELVPAAVRDMVPDGVGEVVRVADRDRVTGVLVLDSEDVTVAVWEDEGVMLLVTVFGGVSDPLEVREGVFVTVAV